MLTSSTRGALSHVTLLITLQRNWDTGSVSPHPVRFAHSNPACEFGAQKLQSAPRNYTCKVPLRRRLSRHLPRPIADARGGSWRGGRMGLPSGLR